MAGAKRKDHQRQQQQQPKTQPQHRQTLDAADDDYSLSNSKKCSRAPKLHQREEKLISSNLSSKILEEARKQQREIEQEADEGQMVTAFSAVTENPSVVDEDEDDVDAFDGFSETQSVYDCAVQEIDEEDERVLANFMSENAGPQLTLADIIIQKIKEKDAEVNSEAQPLPKLDSSIIDLYKGVGKLLSRYTNGKIPKAFKHIPYIRRWEDVLYLTEPENWSPNAMFQATRIFSSNLGVKGAQRFYNLVLLPRIRDNIRKNKRLHFALYQSMKKSLYKPAAFFKGILFPLCQSGTCSLREAVIVGSIIQKVSIPPLHSSAALMKLAEMDYCGTTRYKNELTKEDKENLELLILHQKHHLVTPEVRRELKNSRNRGEKEDDIMSISSPISIIYKRIEEDRFDFPKVPMEED